MKNIKLHCFWKKTISLSINIELDELLDKECEEKNINKSKYIEYLIKKDKICNYIEGK